ncbi:heterokaryon incompatibility protein-domain-containing protein [Xylariales sp. PMI_506]|nr:heterokaryon incompatibility protein-domain-containing protein [Xylariales sp. PMI_506]
MTGDSDGSDLAWRLGNLGLGPLPGSRFDNFYTPRNESFYSTHKYHPLDGRRREIRLLKVFPEKKTEMEHLLSRPRWFSSRFGQVSSKGTTGTSTPTTASTEPASCERLLACELVDRIPLSKCTGMYQALSYAAGSAESTAEILVNGVIFNAFTQLVHAIECAAAFHRKSGTFAKDEFFLLWVDQICINQSDDGERAQQVMLMQDIYSNCASTLVCLSVQNDSPAVKMTPALQWFTNMSKPLSLMHHFWNNGFNRESRYSWLGSFLVFLRSPWWTRSWVYQEFVSSPEVYFMYEEDSATWKDISKCLSPSITTWCEEWISRLSNNHHLADIHAQQELDEEAAAQGRNSGLRKAAHRRSTDIIEAEVEASINILIGTLSTPDVKKSMRSVEAMLEGRRIQDKATMSSADLRTLLRHSRCFRATDARDKVYAFAGLARREYKFAPSYALENTAVHVHHDAARRILKYDGDLTYLLEQAFAGRGELGFLLPSWVPDWNSREDHTVLQELKDYIEVQVASTEKPSEFSASPYTLTTDFPESGDEQFSLRVSGRRVLRLEKRGKLVESSLQEFRVAPGIEVYTPRTARLKDEIWNLSGCEWLVVLQHEELNRYYFKGFAVAITVDGETPCGDAVEEVLLI